MCGSLENLDYNYGENLCPAAGPQSNSSGWDLGQDGKLWNGRNGRGGKLSHSNDVIGACICPNDANVCGSAHCVCVVDGKCGYASFLSIIISIVDGFGGCLVYMAMLHWNNIVRSSNLVVINNEFVNETGSCYC